MVNERVLYQMQDVGMPANPQSGTPTPGGIVTQYGNIRWTVEEILDWITDAQRAITLLRPNSNNFVGVIPLAQGPRQKLPNGGWFLLTVNNNMDSTGTKYGRAITLTTFDMLNRENPNWRSDPPSSIAYNYTFDLTDQKAFFVWPPNDGTGYCECNWVKTPDQHTDMTQIIELDDIFMPIIVDYCCMRASMKDAEYGPGLEYSKYFQGLFMAQLTGKDQAEKEQSPDAALPTKSNR